MFGRIDHVGIVVADTQGAVRLYRDTLGMTAGETFEHPGEHVRITFLRSGDDLVELLEPTAADTGVARFLERRGPGMHHICFEVSDIETEILRLGEAGLEVLDQTPRRGMHGERLAFVHPKSVMGVLIELYETGSRDGDVLAVLGSDPLPG